MNYNHSKLGNWLCKVLYKSALFLSRYKFLYYFLNFTWGLVLTLVGYVITLVLLMCGKKPTKYHGIHYFAIGQSWGGMEMGIMFLRDTTSSEHVSKHELGHTYQNAILGPFMLFIVSIPSAIRYWYQEFRTRKGKSNKPYDAIWFEDSATCIGTTIVDNEGR